MYGTRAVALSWKLERKKMSIANQTLAPYAMPDGEYSAWEGATPHMQCQMVGSEV